MKRSYNLWSQSEEVDFVHFLNKYLDNPRSEQEPKTWVNLLELWNEEIKGVERPYTVERTTGSLSSRASLLNARMTRAQDDSEQMVWYPRKPKEEKTASPVVVEREEVPPTIRAAGKKKDEGFSTIEIPDHETIVIHGPAIVKIKDREITIS